MTLETTTISGLTNANAPLNGSERVPMDQGTSTRDATTAQIAALATPAIEAAIDAHLAAADPHPGYLTPAEGNAAYEPAGTAASAVAAHAAAADPHPGYLTPAEGNAAYEAAGAVASHVAAADPHTQYAQTAGDLGLGTDDSPTFAGLTITGTAPVAIPHIHGSIAGNFYIHVRNTSGAPLAAGTAVYVTGSVGDTDRLTVAACDPTDTAKMPAVAILETALGNNGDGDAIILGELRPLNTAAFSLNQPLYVGAAGLLTGSVPTSGIVQAVGTVARAQSNTGTIVVHIGDRLGTAALAAASAFAPAAQGVTNGNSHDHNSGDGAQIAYSSLSGLPSIPAPADAVPLAPGTAAVGTSTEYAREDHVHPLPGLVTSSTPGLARPQDFGDVIVLACSDETTDLATGTARVTFRMPWAATLTAVRLSVNTAPTGSALIVDVNEAGASVFSTRPQIDANAKTSVGSTVTPVISDSALAADAEITVDIDQVGSTIKGKGLKVALYVTRA